MARDAWTDERLGDMKGSVDAGFQANREEFRALRREIRESAEGLREESKALHVEMADEFKAVRADMRAEFKAVRGEIAGVRGEMREIRAELGALNRTIHQFTFALVGTVFLGFMGTIAALFSLAQ
jgi:uncharacterized coiled-coil DUF342 family protein